MKKETNKIDIISTNTYSSIEENKSHSRLRILFINNNELQLVEKEMDWILMNDIDDFERGRKTNQFLISIIENNIASTIDFDKVVEYIWDITTINKIKDRIRDFKINQIIYDHNTNKG